MVWQVFSSPNWLQFLPPVFNIGSQCHYKVVYTQPLYSNILLQVPRAANHEDPLFLLFLLLFRGAGIGKSYKKPMDLPFKILAFAYTEVEWWYSQCFLSWPFEMTKSPKLSLICGSVTHSIRNLCELPYSHILRPWLLSNVIKKYNDLFK